MSEEFFQPPFDCEEALSIHLLRQVSKTVLMSGGIQYQTNSSDEILSAIDIARELRCSKAHIYNVILGRVAGVTPLLVIVMGRRRLVRRSSFELWKRSNEHEFVPAEG